MTTVNLSDLTHDQLADHLAAWLEQTLPGADIRRLFVPMLRELATGEPVEPTRLAALAGVPLERTLAVLREMGGEWDASGERLVGLGLTSKPTRHRFEVHGHRLWTWCAPDALMFPVLVGAPARVASPCVATGEVIHIDLSPRGVHHVEPAGAVVSFVTPRVELAAIRQAVCNPSNFYRSAQAAARWQAQHPEALVLPVADAFEVSRRAVTAVWGDELLAG